MKIVYGYERIYDVVDHWPTITIKSIDVFLQCVY